MIKMSARNSLINSKINYQRDTRHRCEWEEVEERKIYKQGHLGGTKEKTIFKAFHLFRLRLYSVAHAATTNDRLRVMSLFKKKKRLVLSDNVGMF